MSCRGTHQTHVLGIKITDDHLCVDIDECKLGTSRCQQLCINEDGSYTCDCRSGFQLNTTDNVTCIGNYMQNLMH